MLAPFVPMTPENVDLVGARAFNYAPRVAEHWCSTKVVFDRFFGLRFDPDAPSATANFLREGAR